MSEANTPGRTHLVRENEVYSIGYGQNVHEWHSRRNATSRAGFLLPYLRPRMNLLDCGCGPGTITVGLAEIVAPGMVVGIDKEPLQVVRARALAAKQGLANVRFVVGNIHALPFPDASFDVVFAHNVLEHLNGPLAALKEMKRLLKPGGMVAIRDPDFSTGFIEPKSPLVQEAFDLLLRVREHSGGSPYYARHQRQLLLEAGFARTEAFAFADYQGNADDARAFAGVLIEPLYAPATLGVAISLGWIDHSKLDAMAEAIRAWSQRPECFHTLMDCAAIGWMNGLEQPECR